MPFILKCIYFYHVSPHHEGNAPYVVGIFVRHAFFMRIKTIGSPCFTLFAIVFTPYIFCLPINFAIKKFKNYNKLGSSTIINNTSTIINLTHLL